MKEEITLPKLTCTRCGHVWVTRIPKKPKQCPQCHSPYWNIQRKGKKGKKGKDSGKEISVDKKSLDIITFDYLLTNVRQWIYKANELVNAAYKLETDIDPFMPFVVNRRFRYVYLMLIGFALECYYKGAIIEKQNKKGRQPNGKLDSQIKKHELDELALDAGVELAEIGGTLRYLTECIKWRGRYPTPIFASAIDGSIKWHSKNNDNNFILSTSEPIIPINDIHYLIDGAVNQIKRNRL